MLAIGIGSNLVLSGQPFSPANLVDGLVWLKASDTNTITHDESVSPTEGAVSQIDDKFGNGNNGTQGVSANQPITGTITQNGKNVLDFDGTNDMLSFPNLGLDGETDVTVFLVFNVDSTTSGADNPLSFGSGSEGQILMGSSATAQSFALGFFSDLTALAVGVEDSANILTVVTSATTSRSYKNGTLVAEDLTPPSAWTTGAGTYGIMASNTPNRWTKGQFCELIILGHTSSDDERNAVEAYLINEWGI